MEIKTQVEILNEIANKLGDTSPDEMITESQALQNILDHMDGGGGGGGGDVSDIFFPVEVHINEDNSIDCEYKTIYDLREAYLANTGKIVILKVTAGSGFVPEYYISELGNQDVTYSKYSYDDDTIYLERYSYIFPFVDTDPIVKAGYGYEWSVTSYPLD